MINEKHDLNAIFKLCPLMSNPEIAVQCQKEGCAWYDSKFNRCAFVSAALKK